MKYRENWQTCNMKIFKNKLLAHIVKYSLFTGVILVFVAMGHVYVTVSELKLKLNETKIALTTHRIQGSNLEKNSKVLKENLDSYLKFSKNRFSKSDRMDFYTKNQLDISGNEVFVNIDTELPELESNSCKRIRCIQIRKQFHHIPSNIWKALLGTEDFRFLDHAGIDPIAITRAIVVDIIAMKFIQGGSTLTQQLVKNLFLTNEKKLSRKLKEIIYAVYIENILEKEEILALYLNEVFWGTHGGVYLKGFYAASLAYFDKAPEHLSDFEATILVSLLKGPNYYSLKTGHKRIKNRAEAVYSRLISLNLFTQNEETLWDEGEWNRFEKNYLKRNNEKDFWIYYLTSVNREYGLEPFEKISFYRAAIAKQDEHSERFKDVDFGVKALILDLDCSGYDCVKGFSYYSKLERNKRAAITDEVHQVGSLLKPIVYDSFIENGRSYEEEISTAPITLNLKSGKWTPKDYSKTKIAKVTLKTALQKSKNIPLIRVASEVGFDILEEKLNDYIPRLKSPLSEYPAQLLGAVELSLEEVIKSYTKFIKNKCELISDKKIAFEGSILEYMSVAQETTISRLARDPLKSSLIFGKTGTSNNGLDNWYFAFDGRQIFVIWFGVETDRNDKDLRISGATTAFLIFQNFVNFRGKEVSEVICK